MKFINSCKLDSSATAASTTTTATTFLSRGTAKDPARTLFMQVDVDRNGVLNFDEFASWWARRLQLTVGRASALDAKLLTTMRELWAELDLDGSGDLTCEEFGDLLSQLGATDWEEVVDPATSRSYFVNSKTNETR